MGKTQDALKKLQIVNERIKTSHKIVVEQRYLNRLVKRLSQSVNGVKNLPNLQTVQALFNKARNIYLNGDGYLTSRERRNLPFILANASDEPGMVEFIFRQIDLQKFSVFKRAVFVYFQTYGDEQLTVKLRGYLLDAIDKDPRKNNISYLYNHAELICPMGPQKMAEHFKNGVKQYFDTISLPMVLQHSRFVHWSLIRYFQKVSDDLYHKMETLCIVYKDEADKIIIPQIAESLILSVNQSGNQDYRDSLLNILHHEMGDPRYSHQQTKWSQVGENAKTIFISWLKRGDLDLFFGIIDRTMRSDLNYQVNAKQMWHDRKVFWEKYLGKMYYTKVVLAPEAAGIARREYWNKILDYGKLDSSNKNQSLFVFSIGKYVFVEPSYNGTLRIWHLDNSPVPLDSALKNHYPINYSDDIVHNYNEVEAFVHSGNWQSRVSWWIRTHC